MLAAAAAKTYDVPILPTMYVLTDKLAQSKLRDRELREAHRSEVQATKEANSERRRALLEECKAERQLHETKRAAKDKREVRIAFTLSLVSPTDVLGFVLFPSLPFRQQRGKLML